MKRRTLLLSPLLLPLARTFALPARADETITSHGIARYLNLTVGYDSQLERGAKRPSGPALVLLNVIRRKGIEAIL